MEPVDARNSDAAATAARCDHDARTARPAKVASTLAILTSGRVILGVCAGDPKVVRAYGGPDLDPDRCLVTLSSWLRVRVGDDAARGKLMRIQSSVTSLSWIPSEAIPGVTKLPFTLGINHYDAPPPDRLDDLAALHTAGRFRFINRLAAWIDVDDDGRITAAGHEGEGLIGFTVFAIGGRSMTVPGVAYPDIQHEPEFTEDGVRFVQTAGGRPGMPFPRTVNRPPYIQITAPTVWTTLALTIRSDGSATHEVVGATPFPRHWIYDDTGTLVQKSGLTDLRSWAGENYGERTPWGEHDQQAIITTVESALERTLSTLIMQGDAKPRIRKIRRGATVTEQGEPGDELYLILDGMLNVEIDGRALAEIGPGAIVGERAVLEGGHRTSTLRAITPCRVAVASASQIDREALIELSKGHHREDTPPTDDPASER